MEDKTTPMFDKLKTNSSVEIPFCPTLVSIFMPLVKLPFNLMILFSVKFFYPWIRDAVGEKINLNSSGYIAIVYNLRPYATFQKYACFFQIFPIRLAGNPRQ